MAGLKESGDSSKELTNHRITHDNDNLQAVMQGIEDTMNPLDTIHNDDDLYNLASGNAASETVKYDLLHAMEIGKDKCSEFIQSCLQDGARFSKPIHRSKLKNFSSDAMKVKTSAKDNKIKELQGTRDLFGRLLYLAVTNNINLEIVFGYPLTPVPLSLAHIDGSINKTDKSKLMHTLENEISSSSPESQSACAVDAMFFIRTITDLPATYVPWQN